MAFEVGILLDIALILLVAKVFGEIAERMGISSLVGEIFAGMLLGPITGLIKPGVFLEQISTFGILFLLFIIGLNTRFEDVKKDTYKGSILAIAAAGLSFIAGMFVGLFVFSNLSVGVFLGIAMMSTSTAITLRSLIDIGEMKTRVYDIALAVDMADEVLAILALSALATYFTYGGVQIWTVIALFFAVLGFFLIVMTVGTNVVNKFLNLFKIMRDENILVSIPLVIVFFVAFLSEQIGIAGVTGAFLAGMAMSKSNLTENVIAPKVKIIGYGFFIPLFFAYSAILFDISVLLSSAGAILLLLILGSAAKVIGAGYLSRIYKFGPREQSLIGISMIPRGEYAIVISQIALGAAIITRDIYTIAISFVVISILVTPILLRFASRRKGF